MISFDSATKEAYKSDTREIKTKANLYLAKQRLSKNAFNPYAEKTINQPSYLTVTTNLYEQIIVDISSSLAKRAGYVTIPITLKTNTDYVFTLKYRRTDITNGAGVGIRNRNNVFLASDLTNDLQGTITLSFNSGSDTLVDLWLYSKNTASQVTVANTFTYYEIMLNEGTEALPFEYYGKYAYDYTEFPLTEENEAKVLSFSIDEKCDVYYTSLPCNTMTIEVDNEKGYFTDYDEDSIVRKLNKDCYVELYLSINDGDYKKIMKMNFDKISYSDYYKAKLSFKSNISKLKDLPLRDRNEDFTKTSWGRAGVASWFNANYDIRYVYSGTNITTLNSTDIKANSVENILLASGSKLSSLEYAGITTNDTQDRIVLKNWKSTADDKITKDYELEKPILKRENTYDGLQYTYCSSQTYTQSNETYNRVIDGVLTSMNEALVIRDNDYKLSTLTSSNISITGNPTLEVVTYSSNDNIVILKLSGNLGDEYTITINKSNIYKKESEALRTKKLGNVNDNSKVLTIYQTSPLYYDYYNLILNEKKIKSYVEVKLMGLPYLELGDTIEVETDNANVLITISEIELNFENGLIQTICGYELGWDTLFPSDTLYPNDELLPNTPIE